LQVAVVGSEALAETRCAGDRLPGLVLIACLELAIGLDEGLHPVLVLDPRVLDPREARQTLPWVGSLARRPAGQDRALPFVVEMSDGGEALLSLLEDRHRLEEPVLLDEDHPFQVGHSLVAGLVRFRARL